MDLQDCSNSDSGTESSDDDIPINNIRVQISIKSIKSIYYEYLQDNNLLLAPEYQRDLCWSVEKMNLFIDTIFKEWIVPNYVIYQLSAKEQKHNDFSNECIDGQHRLTTIKYYMENTMIPGTNKYIHWLKNGERVYYNMDNTTINNLNKKRHCRSNCRNLTKDEKAIIDNFQMSFHIITSQDGLDIGTKCCIFNRLQNGEKVSSYQKLKNLHTNTITNTIRSNKLCELMVNISFENKIKFIDTKPKEIKSYYLYFLIRSFLIIDKKSLEINFLDLNIKKYLEASNGQGAPNVKLHTDVMLLYPKVCEIINWITTSNKITHKLLSEVVYLYICIYANYGIADLNLVVEYFNNPKHNNTFLKINDIKTYKQRADKVTSSAKMINVYENIVKKILYKNISSTNNLQDNLIDI
jgi:hypothetical protein